MRYAGPFVVFVGLLPFALALTDEPLRLVIPLVVALLTFAMGSRLRRPVEQQVAFGLLLGVPQLALWSLMWKLLEGTVDSLLAGAVIALALGISLGCVEVMREGGLANQATFDFYFETFTRWGYLVAAFACAVVWGLWTQPLRDEATVQFGTLSGLWASIALTSALFGIAGLCSMVGHIFAARVLWSLVLKGLAEFYTGVTTYLAPMSGPLAGFFVGYLAIVLWFGGVYNAIYLYDPIGAFRSTPEGAALSFGDFVYLSVITFATVGYGDITPASLNAKLAASIEAVAQVFWVVAVFAAMLNYIYGNRPASASGRGESANDAL